MGLKELKGKGGKGMFKNALIFSLSMADGDTQQEARFNMGIATLERIHTSLEKIRWGFEFLHGIPRQRFHIDQVKILFMNMAPLLKSKKVDEYKDDIDNLKLKSKLIRGRQVVFYDQKLEARLFGIVREWTLELEKYFMPQRSAFAGL